MHYAPRDSARDLRLSLLERGHGVVLLTSCKRGFDCLDEGADPANASAIDRRTAGIAADALLGLRRVRHREILQIPNESGARPWGRTGVAIPLASRWRIVNRCL